MLKEGFIRTATVKSCDENCASLEVAAKDNLLHAPPHLLGTIYIEAEMLRSYKLDGWDGILCRLGTSNMSAAQ